MKVKMVQFLEGFLLTTQCTYELYETFEEAAYGYLRHYSINSNVSFKLVCLIRGMIKDEFIKFDFNERQFVSIDGLRSAPIGLDNFVLKNCSKNKFITNPVIPKIVVPAPPKDKNEESVKKQVVRPKWKPIEKQEEIKSTTSNASNIKPYTLEVFKQHYESFEKMSQDIENEKLKEDNIHPDFLQIYDLFNVCPRNEDGKIKYEDMKELAESMLVEYGGSEIIEDCEDKNCEDECKTGTCSKPSAHASLFGDDPFLARKKERMNKE